MPERLEPEDDDALAAMGGQRASKRQIVLFALAGALVAAMLAGAAHVASMRDRPPAEAAPTSQTR